MSLSLALYGFHHDRQVEGVVKCTTELAKLAFTDEMYSEDGTLLDCIGCMLEFALVT